MAVIDVMADPGTIAGGAIFSFWAVNVPHMDESPFPQYLVFVFLLLLTTARAQMDRLVDAVNMAHAVGAAISQIKTKPTPLDRTWAAEVNTVRFPGPSKHVPVPFGTVHADFEIATMLGPQGVFILFIPALTNLRLDTGTRRDRASRRWPLVVPPLHLGEVLLIHEREHGSRRTVLADGLSTLPRRRELVGRHQHRVRRSSGLSSGLHHLFFLLS